MADQEQWSWGKFFGGFVDGKNYAKAIVMMVCMGIILTLALCTYSVVKNKFFEKPIPTSTQQIGTNTGFVSTTTESTEKKGWQLFGGLVQINN